jgi:stage IV sporulation protein FB
MEENNINIDNSFFYPPKPVIEENKANKDNAVRRSLFSLIIFIGVFYFFFDVDIRLIFVVVAALIIHELGHFFTMERFGYKDLKIFFVPLLGAYVSGENENISQKQKAWVYLAGPIPGIILGAIFLLVWLQTGKENLLLLATVFLYINAFNLLPLTPLDGGKFMETLFFHSNELIQIVFIIVSIVGVIVFSIFFEYYIFLFFALILGAKLYGQISTFLIRRALKKIKLNINASYDELNDEDYWKIREVIINTSSLYKKVPKNMFRYHEKEPLILNHLKIVLKKIPEKDLTVFMKITLLIMWTIALCSPLALYFVTVNPTN